MKFAYLLKRLKQQWFVVRDKLSYRWFLLRLSEPQIEFVESLKDLSVEQCLDRGGIALLIGDVDSAFLCFEVALYQPHNLAEHVHYYCSYARLASELGDYETAINSLHLGWVIADEHHAGNLFGLRSLTELATLLEITGRYEEIDLLASNPEAYFWQEVLCS